MSSGQDWDPEAIKRVLDAIHWRLEGIQRELRALRIAQQAAAPLPAEVLAEWLRPPVKAKPRV